MMNEIEVSIGGIVDEHHETDQFRGGVCGSGQQ